MCVCMDVYMHGQASRDKVALYEYRSRRQMSAWLCLTDGPALPVESSLESLRRMEEPKLPKIPCLLRHGNR